jgi:predicted glycosyltransferase
LSTSNPSRVLIYVQHLLGVGHLQRAIRLSSALLRQGFRVDLVSGGMPGHLSAAQSPTAQSPTTQTLRTHQLAPLYSPDGSFSRLLDVNGNDIDDHWREQRKQQLLEIFDACAPQVLITETFPFGRRMLQFELLPLLRASRESGDCKLVIASIRDILQPKSKPGRNRETCDLIDAWYDRVLIHGDENIARLEDSFALSDRIEDKLFYSGYICAQEAHSAPAGEPTGEGVNEVLVSAGGSATGLQILQTALRAKPLSSLNHLHWRLLVSQAIPAADFKQLQATAGDGVTVERNRPDFSELIKRAQLSISQAGYNTMTDLLNSDTAAVVIPYAEADEKEQSMRAHALQARGRVIALAQSGLAAASLADAINAATNASLCQRPELAVNLNGAANSATMIKQWLQNAEAML